MHKLCPAQYCVTPYYVPWQTGIRFQPARATTNQKDAVPGRPCPDALLEDEQDAMQDMQRCIEQFHDDSRYGLCLILCNVQDGKG